MVRTVDTARPKELDRRITAEGWIALLLFSHGGLVLEAWGSPSVLADTVEHDGFTPIGEAAASLGITTGDLVERMISDGLFIDLDGRLVASPHPDIRKTPRY